MSLGFISPPTGFALLFSNLQAIGDGRNPLLFIVSLALIGFGVYLIIHASKERKEAKVFEVHKPDGENIIEKNNRLASDWDKTVTAESRLKMLELKAEADEKAGNA